MTRRTHHGPRHHARPSHKERVARQAVPGTTTAPPAEAVDEVASAVASAGTEPTRVIGRPAPEPATEVEAEVRMTVDLAGGTDDLGGRRHTDGPGEVTHLRPAPVPGMTHRDAAAPAVDGGAPRDRQRDGRPTGPMNESRSAHDGPWLPPIAETADGRASCTAPQLRRFIKSRAYVPMHELRRRFGIEGGDDEVTPVDLDSGRIFVGLPSPEGQLLGELLRAGDIGYELSFDPISPIVVGVYPMRPIARG
jgi:hypothetical protein